MDRKRTLNRIIGPTKDGTAFTWTFHYPRKKRFSLDHVSGRHFRLCYSPSDRTFTLIGYRRVSKRNKRQEVTCSKAMAAYLRTRLSPADLAKCTRSSMSGWVTIGPNGEW